MLKGTTPLSDNLIKTLIIYSEAPDLRSKLCRVPFKDEVQTLQHRKLSCPHPNETLCVCVSLLSGVPPSLQAKSPLFLLAAMLRAPMGAALPPLLVSPFFIYFILPLLPSDQSSGEADISSSFCCSHTLPSSLWVFVLPVDLHPHPYSLSLFPPCPKVTTNPVPCLLDISLFFFLLRRSSGESLTFVHACGCRTVQPARTQTIICHANTDAPGDYSSRSARPRHGNPHFKLSVQIKRKGLAISHT